MSDQKNDKAEKITLTDDQIVVDRQLGRRSALQALGGLAAAGAVATILAAPGEAQAKASDSDPNDAAGAGRTGRTDHDPNDGAGRGRGSSNGHSDSDPNDAGGAGRTGRTDHDPNDGVGRGRH